MTAEIKHYINPLHVYCRLRDLGMRKGSASFICRVYDRLVYKRLYQSSLSSSGK